MKGALSDDETRYGYGTIALHWLAAACAIYLIWNGYQLLFLPRGPEKGAAIALHLSFGWALCLLVLLRIVWRLTNTVPALAGEAHWSDRLARPAHWLLLILLALLAITGYVAATTGGRPTSIWGWFDAPRLFGRNRALHHYTEEAHGWLSHVFVALLAAHVLAALMRQFVWRDGTLGRMVFVRRASPGDDQDTAARPAPPLT